MLESSTFLEPKSKAYHRTKKKTHSHRGVPSSSTGCCSSGALQYPTPELLRRRGETLRCMMDWMEDLTCHVFRVVWMDDSWILLLRFVALGRCLDPGKEVADVGIGFPNICH